MNFGRAIFLLAVAVLTAGVAHAREISPDDAIDDVGRFARGRHGRRGRGPSGEARTYSVDGTNLFHTVALEGGGFVAVAGMNGDADSPILGFSESGDMPEIDPGSPLWALLSGDSARRRGMNPRHAMRKKPHIKKHDKRPKQKKSLLAADGSLLVSSATDFLKDESLVADMRVEPLVKSKWNQSTVGGKNVYNYYTPNNYVCGCVATAMAQLMRYHEYPKSEIAQHKFMCYVGTGFDEIELEMKGGVYDWSNMPFDPENETITTNIQEAIGALCYDAGVSVRMNYAFNEKEESGAYSGFEFDSLKNVFGYKNSQSYINRKSGINERQIENAILTNLDGGFPVLLGIESSSGPGHAVVADGYGYREENLYCHINMGWSGLSDFWYALPNIQEYNMIYTVVYNVFPCATGELLTGRIVDEEGSALSNATVTAAYGGVVTNVTASAHGIYSFIIDLGASSQTNVTVYAGYGEGRSSATNTVTLTASVSPTNLDFDYGSFDDPGMFVGNSWGNDFTILPAKGSAASISSFTLPDLNNGVYARVDFSGTAGARYQLEWTDALTNQVWNVYTNILLNVNGADTIPIMLDPASPSRFYRLSTSTWK